MNELHIVATFTRRKLTAQPDPDTILDRAMKRKKIIILKFVES
jgi:hypothetical protein